MTDGPGPLDVGADELIDALNRHIGSLTGQQALTQIKLDKAVARIKELEAKDAG